MQRTNANKISLLINEFIREQGLEEGLLRVRIFKAWDVAVGEAAARHTASKYFNKGVLYCTINSSMLRTQLGFRKDEIINRINELLGETIVGNLVLR